MSESFCGIDCKACSLNETCNGCIVSDGRPFGGTCVLAKACEHCQDNKNCITELKNQLIAEFNGLGIPDMPAVTELYSLHGAFINLEYELPNGLKVKLWDDDRVYLGNQLEKTDSDRCYGIVADENFLMVCEYGCNGSEPDLILFKKR